MLNKLDLVLVIPAYNEEGCIKNVIDLWTQGISNILKNKLDQYSIPNLEGGKVKIITANAYIRDPKEYSSDMEVNYA